MEVIDLTDDTSEICLAGAESPNPPASTKRKRCVVPESWSTTTILAWKLQAFFSLSNGTKMIDFPIKSPSSVSNRLDPSLQHTSETLSRLTLLDSWPIMRGGRKSTARATAPASRSLSLSPEPIDEPQPASSQIEGLSTAHTMGKRKNTDRDEETDSSQTRKKATISRKSCIVCTDDTARNQLPKLPHKQDDEDEQHDSDVCFKCYREHLSIEVKDEAKEVASCPQCSKVLEQDEFRKLASSHTYQAYLDKAAKKCMQDEEEFHSCPNAECPWGALFAKGDGNILACQMCDARYCLSCEVPFHEEQTCEEYQTVGKRHEADEQKSLDTVKQLSRPCPGPNCGINIDKFSGCDHVTCRRCRYEFCWEYFAPYKGASGIGRIGNAAHEETCKHREDRLPAYQPDSDIEDDEEYPSSDDGY